MTDEEIEEQEAAKTLDAKRNADNLQYCSCRGCGNRRSWEGPTRQEVKAALDMDQSLEDYYAEPWHVMREYLGYDDYDITQTEYDSLDSAGYNYFMDFDGEEYYWW